MINRGATFYIAFDLQNACMNELKNRGFERELNFKASKSGGKGGQHVNKVMTKIELTFNVPASKILTEEEKSLLFLNLAGKLSSQGALRIAAETFRSQLQNKEAALERFYKLLEKSLKKRKPRTQTVPTKQSAEKRHKAKQIKGEKKKNRRKVILNATDS